MNSKAIAGGENLSPSTGLVITDEEIINPHDGNKVPVVIMRPENGEGGEGE
eukprot:CAMPEP_0119139630 /NCGR_PEP_ID=MMETSP1310-20130426/27831_1 /TAXON_ID=464262 /ORGANISM="Genus nov. species nov., Strain RCC2339" /LENGTH=50 /DNA_ID=CAMNT_0007130941 /DNA_START=177 /DNA_END=326 /DNA_ORIENTATION=-